MRLSHRRQSRETSFSVLLWYSGCGSLYQISMAVNFWVRFDDRTCLIWIRNSQCSNLDDCNIDVMSEFFTCLEEPALYIVGTPEDKHRFHVFYIGIIHCAADMTWLSCADLSNQPKGINKTQSGTMIQGLETSPSHCITCLGGWGCPSRCVCFCEGEPLTNEYVHRSVFQSSLSVSIFISLVVSKIFITLRNSVDRVQKIIIFRK